MRISGISDMKLRKNMPKATQRRKCTSLMDSTQNNGAQNISAVNIWPLSDPWKLKELHRSHAAL
jgi:hypothetical protein